MANAMNPSCAEKAVIPVIVEGLSQAKPLPMFTVHKLPGHVEMCFGAKSSRLLGTYSV
jgi:hypothetical protein